MQTFFSSVKNRKASKPPSRPTPDCFIPPNGVRRVFFSRTYARKKQKISDATRVRI
jgi:hypothetical protein